MSLYVLSVVNMCQDVFKISNTIVNTAALVLQRAFVQFHKLLKCLNFRLESPAVAAANRWPSQQRPSYQFFYNFAAATPGIDFLLT